VQEVKYKNTDFTIDWFSGTGAGGQHRNKHQNSCRITHLPTGLVTTAQCRSRINSQDQAMAAMLEQLKGGAIHEQRIATAQDRKQQVGSGMRGDKIRTYRFQDDIVKDHNSEKTASVNKVLKGYFDLMW
jgi:peptide chain release factor 1